MAQLAWIQPAIAGDVFKGADVGDLQRWLWFSTTDDGLTPERGEFDRLTEAEWAVPEEVRRDPKFTDKYQGKRITLPIPRAVADEVWAAHIARQKGEVHDNDGHRNQMRLRVAGLCALLDGRMRVSIDDWRLAGEILDRSDTNREVVQTYLAKAARDGHRSRGLADEERADAAMQGRVERVAVRIWKAVAQHNDDSAHGAETCTQACASRALETPTRDYLDAALALAQDRRWLIVRRTTTSDSVKAEQAVVRLSLGKARPKAAKP